MRFLVLFIALSAAAGGAAASPAAEPILEAHYPALSPDASKICFEYLGDLWIVSSDGGRATRLTVHPAYEAYPHWSPDGRSIAFSSKREGGYDVYVVPSEGGTPERITFHSANDIVYDWTPDGKGILFYTNRDTRMSNLYTIDLQTKRFRRITNEFKGIQAASYSHDGKWLLVSRGTGGWNRPKYKGSANADIYLLPVAQGESRQLTDYIGNDMWPMPSPDGKAVYFVSCRPGSDTPEGVANIWKMNADGKGAAQLTHFKGDSTFWPSISRDGRLIVFEEASGIWVVPTGPGQPKKLDIFAPSDVVVNDLMHENYHSGVQSLSVTNDAKKIAFTVHGEVFWVKTKIEGDAERLTDTPQREKDVAWSPDGRWLAFISNRSGTDNLYIIDMKTENKEVVRLTTGDQMEYSPVWSPDSEKIAFVRGAFGQQIVLIPPEGGGEKVLVAAPYVGGVAWSPDSKWIAFTRDDTRSTTDIWLVPADGSAAPVNITDYPGWNGDPEFSRDGKWLVFRSDRSGDAQVFRLRLQQVDEQSEQEAEKEGEEELEPWEQKRKTYGSPEKLEIDLDRITLRSEQLTSVLGGAWNFAITRDSKNVLFSATTAGKHDIWKIPIYGGGLTQLTSWGESPGGFIVPAEGEDFFYTAGGYVKKLSTGGGSPHTVGFNARMDVSRSEEMYAVFDEGWEALNQQFYDPDFHGCDWEAMKRKYRPLVANCALKEDLYNIVSRMLGELNASHLGIYSWAGGPLQTGYLGILFDEGYTGPGILITDVIPGTPATLADSELKAGEYILSVDGKDVKTDETLYLTLEDKVGKKVKLQVNARPTTEGARTVEIRPIGQGEFSQLLYDKWVDDNEKLVNELSGGRVAYIHIQGMGQESFAKFKRWLYSSRCQDKDGLIVDVRYNGGGWLHDDLYAEFAKRQHAYEKLRGQPRRTMPYHFWNRPTIMMTNEYSGSDAEIVPSGFRELGFGKLLGMPTYGGVIGTFDIGLLDGETGFRVPCSGWWTLDGTNLENYGVPPDIRVENSLADAMQGHDRQLEEAVHQVVKELPAKQ
jgi:tricorn protease